MDFALSAEQQLLRETARDVLTSVSPIEKVRASMEDTGGGTGDDWRRIAALGWLGLPFAETYGGAALSFLDLALLVSETGRVLLPAPYLATMTGGLALQLCGSEGQRRQWLPPICDGSTTATLAVAEERGSWEAADLTASARAAGAGYVLTGRKLFVPDAAVADVIVTVLRDAETGEYLVATIERDAAALEPLDVVDRTRRFAAVTLDGVEIGAAAVAPCGAAALDAALARARVALAAEMAGGMERVLELTIAYAKVREQFGRPIGSFQAIQHRCADMLVAVECARTATQYAAWALDAGASDAVMMAAGAKALASDGYRDVTAAAIQIHGGIGFTWEHDLHLYFKRALANDAMFGDAVRNRERVARALGL